MTRRRATRKEVNLPVKLGNGKSATARNISRSGILLQMERKLPPGWIVDIHLEIDGEPLSFCSRVVEARDDGVALSIVMIDPSTLERLEQLVGSGAPSVVATVEARNPSPANPSPADPSVDITLVDDTEEVALPSFVPSQETILFRREDIAGGTRYEPSDHTMIEPAPEPPPKPPRGRLPPKAPPRAVADFQPYENTALNPFAPEETDAFGRKPKEKRKFAESFSPSQKTIKTDVD